jgi:uncharacterized cupredoxin-like copper-binding protein
MKRSIKAAVFTLPALLALLVLAVPAVARQDANVSRKVNATEFKFALPIKSAKRGTVTFMVQNKGKLPHDFKIAGKKSPIIKAGGNTNMKVTFKRRGRYTYICTVPGHAAAGMKGTFIIK